jgi:hypothetical protein
MIRNDKEYRHSKEQLSEFGAELQSLLSGRHSVERDEVASAVVDGPEGLILMTEGEYEGSPSVWA